MYGTKRRAGCQHESDRPDHNRLCRALADHLRGDAPGVFLERLAAAMRHGRAALYRPMGGRPSEVDRGEVAVRISAQQRQSRKGWRDACGLERFRAKACPALDAGWVPVRVKKTRQKKKRESPFRFDRNGKGSSGLADSSNVHAIGEVL